MRDCIIVALSFWHSCFGAWTQLSFLLQISVDFSLKIFQKVAPIILLKKANMGSRTSVVNENTVLEESTGFSNPDDCWVSTRSTKDR